MTRKLRTDVSDGISRQNPLWSKEGTPWGSCPFRDRHPAVCLSWVMWYIFVIIWCIFFLCIPHTTCFIVNTNFCTRRVF